MLFLTKKLISRFLFIIIFASDYAVADKITASGIGIAESKSSACDKALVEAKKDALNQSGVNIFSSLKVEINLNSHNK